MRWEFLTALFAGSVLSGVLPLVNAELLVMGAAAVSPKADAPLIALVSTLGQMIAKTSLFCLARWAPGRLPRRMRAALDKACEAFRRRGGVGGAAVLFSAITGLPPFYAITLATGTLRVPFLTFLGFGIAGRFIHFGVLAWIAGGLGQGASQCVGDAIASLGSVTC